MKKFKKMIATVVAACMMLATCTTTFAAESTSWKIYDYSQYTTGWYGGNGSSGSSNTSDWSWGSVAGWSWGNGSGWNWGGGNKPGTGGDTIVEEDTSLEAPKIGECRYIHQTLNAPDCLTVNWSDVEGAASYEMEMCYSDYSVIATYELDSSRYSVPANRGDKNVTGCCRGRKIRVRAIDQDGNPGKWSEYSTVGCNSLRG